MLPRNPLTRDLLKEANVDRPMPATLFSELRWCTQYNPALIGIRVMLSFELEPGLEQRKILTIPVTSDQIRQAGDSVREWAIDKAIDEYNEVMWERENPGHKSAMGYRLATAVLLNQEL